mmetsp:Transcript_50747/g.130921  ORF Transcript_50747/g.130921 Transcript_50747/m.130921 type:complete len:80 (-) Transcript_50747:231-470(-)
MTNLLTTSFALHTHTPSLYSAHCTPFACMHVCVQYTFHTYTLTMYICTPSHCRHVCISPPLPYLIRDSKDGGEGEGGRF